MKTKFCLTNCLTMSARQFWTTFFERHTYTQLVCLETIKKISSYTFFFAISTIKNTNISVVFLCQDAVAVTTAAISYLHIFIALQPFLLRREHSRGCKSLMTGARLVPNLWRPVRHSTKCHNLRSYARRTRTRFFVRANFGYFLWACGWAPFLLWIKNVTGA